VAISTDSEPLPRERSLHTVLGALRRSPRSSRAELADRTGLSKPTVAAALQALAREGLVRERGRSTGRRGPSASLYEPVADAGRVLGVDIGAHHVRAVVADLEGEPLADMKVTTARPDAGAVLQALREVRAGAGTDRLQLAVVGSPGIVDPRSGRIRSSPNIDGWEGIQAEAVMADLFGVAVAVDNDVNLAALGELARGAGTGHASFAYLNVGSGLGAGLILGGRLHRGRHGAAGEVGYLAAGTGPEDEVAPSRGPMERELSREAIVRIAHDLDPTAPDDPRALFARARTGDPLGRAVVARTAHALAVCVASITAVLDLELVLIGGGIGEQADLLLEPARAAVARMVPYAPEMQAGQLGDRAVLLGAASMGARLARELMVRRCLSV
jgi:predicted NBD/HSP70 family sugar kinase